MITVYILFILGIILLIKGADWLVDGASSLAKKLGVSTLVIGLTVVAFGTSMPELIVNIMAAINNASGVAFGNIIGSNISNILLVLGATALIYNLKIKKTIIKKGIPFAFLSVIVLLVLANKKSGFITRLDGIIMLLFFAIFLYYTYEIFTSSKNRRAKRAEKKSKKIEIQKHSNLIISLMLIGGLIALYFGGIWTVKGAVFIAKQFGLSQFLISATIIAIGTSLPELITSITAALRKDADMAIGNIIGSNIFNILWVLGITSIISPIAIPSFIIIDIIILAVITLLLFSFMFFGKKEELEKHQGILFILLYLAYIIFIVLRG